MVLAHVLAFQTRLSKSGRILDEQDTHLSFLPLAHIFELDNMSMSIIYGIRVGFYSGDVTRILDDMKVLKPTVLAIVPRILNKIYADIQNQFEGSDPKSRKKIEQAVKFKL